MDIISLAQDELETLYLCDGERKSQAQAGICMGVSRGTVQRLLASARSKVAQALVGQKVLAITGNVPEKEGFKAPEAVPLIDKQNFTENPLDEQACMTFSLKGKNIFTPVLLVTKPRDRSLLIVSKGE
jgi:predicted DNA-binding protein (UPF0251 family)